MGISENISHIAFGTVRKQTIFLRKTLIYFNSKSIFFFWNHWQSVSNRQRLFIIKPFHIMKIKFYSFSLDLKSYVKLQQQELITDLHRVQQMWQKLIQTNGWVVSIFRFVDGLSVLIKRPSFFSKRQFLFFWNRTLKSSKEGK